MTPLALVAGVFAAWWVIGLALFAILRADTSDLRIAFTAPVVGSAVMVLPLFLLSYSGVAMKTGAVPVEVALLAVSVAVVAVRKPHLPRAVVPVLVLCVIDALLIGQPFFQFGFHWIATQTTTWRTTSCRQRISSTTG